MTDRGFVRNLCFSYAYRTTASQPLLAVRPAAVTGKAEGIDLQVPLEPQPVKIVLNLILVLQQPVD